MSSAGDTTKWNGLNLLKKTHQSKNLALVILNRPLEPVRKEVDILWSKAVLKAAADGGACRLESLDSTYIPDIITGDFDSCPPATLQRFREKGVDVVVTEDQDNTDFTKCLQVVADRVNDTKEIEVVVCLGAFGGRLDHVMANINTLFTANSLLTKPVVLISDESVAFLLQPGHHQIEASSGLEAEWCGLIPIGSACSDVTTTGLKWNLAGDTLRFGELISTSNTYDGSGVVTVTTSNPLLWTMGYRELTPPS